MVENRMQATCVVIKIDKSVTWLVFCQLSYMAHQASDSMDWHAIL